MIRIVMVGHVDHGKSTILGRLLFELKVLPEGKIEQIKNDCRCRGKNFEYAFLLDALKEERGQGITIDTARCFFSYEGQKYLFFDSPGHIEFIKNMVTGASQTDTAMIVLDALEGIQENSRRHALLLSFFNISKIVVLINKMDLVVFQEAVFEKLKKEYQNFAQKFDIKIDDFIPVSGDMGDNICKLSDRMPWYQGKTVACLLKELKNTQPLTTYPLRFPVQAVYKFNKKRDVRRIVAGNILSGQIQVNDELIFLPSKKTAKIASIEAFSEKTFKPKTTVYAGESTGITLRPQIYVKRGEIACKKAEKQPCVASQFEVSLFWLSPEPLQEGKGYLIRMCTALKNFKVLKVEKVLDTISMQEKKQVFVEQNNIAKCVFSLDEPIVCDLEDGFVETKRFTVINEGKLSGGGIIQKALLSSKKNIPQRKENQAVTFIRAQGFIS